MKKSVKAFSLIEMLITLAILSIVFLITTQTLNTVVRVSTISKYKNTTRGEANFAMELTERLLANSDISSVVIYNSINDREIDSENFTIHDTGSIPDVYAEGSSLALGDIGNEVHVRPYNSTTGWTCIGFFKDHDDDTKGYLIKKYVPDIHDDHASCFSTLDLDTEYPTIFLNSEDVTVVNFEVSYTESILENNLFYVNLVMEPAVWVPTKTNIEKGVYRQSIITTQGLTWY